MTKEAECNCGDEYKYCPTCNKKNNFCGWCGKDLREERGKED